MYPIFEGSIQFQPWGGQYKKYDVDKSFGLRLQKPSIGALNRTNSINSNKGLQQMRNGELMQHSNDRING